jgi:methyl-accepting chemotaxis protein
VGSEMCIRDRVQAVAVFKTSSGQAAFAMPAAAPSAPPKASFPAVERRGPGRAKNVTRPNFSARTAAATSPDAAVAAPAAQRTGTDDWESF